MRRLHPTGRTASRVPWVTRTRGVPVRVGGRMKPGEKDFSATIGADPNDDTNVSQFVLGFRNYQGAASYRLTSASQPTPQCETLRLQWAPRREQSHEHHDVAGPLRHLHRGVVRGLENPARPAPTVGHHTWPAGRLTKDDAGHLPATAD